MSVPANPGTGDDRGGLAIDRLVSAQHRGIMPRLGAATATRAALTIAGYGGDAAIGLDAATTGLAGALAATDKARLDTLFADYLAKPRARAFHSANQSIANNTQTVLAWDSERYDTSNFHSTATNNARLTVGGGLGGAYSVGANVQWASAAGGRRFAYLRVNGGTIVAYAEFAAAATGTTFPALVLATDDALNAADYVEVVVFQDSGGALNVSSGSEFWITRYGG